ncbi:MAG: PAS domain-containing protein [Campylobacterales bacterium]|nr:PAS domain-containing protein [Campylobacterales bacterium]
MISKNIQKKNINPSKSVDQVLLILEEFKAGRKDSAEFWIQLNNKQIHIRYFAVRDENNEYKGVIEMSQDITKIKNLEGKKAAGVGMIFHRQLKSNLNS